MDLKETLRACEADNEQLNQTIEEQGNKIRELEKQVENLNEEVQELKGEVSDAEELISDHNDTVESLNRQIPRAFDAGFAQCAKDYGIWNDGKQTIGCQELPISVVIARGPNPLTRKMALEDIAKEEE
jgi:TolA-binding protein